jgi:predicted dehydrogenase
LNPIRVAIIGCGKIAEQHASQIRRIAGSQLVGVCDSEKRMADQLAERYQVEGSFDNVQQLLKEARPDVVHITTPPQSHFKLANECLSAGCHVYVEKPFSIDLEEAKAMVSLAEDLGLKITAGHNYQFNPEMIRMRELVRNGKLGGTPVHIESIFSYDLGDASYVNALLGDKKHWVRALPGKLLQNVISHGIAKIAEFWESPEYTVTAHGYTSPKLQSAGETDIIDELRVVISDGRQSTAYFSFTTQVAPPVQELRIFGPGGTLIVDGLHRTVIELTGANSAFKSYANFTLPQFNVARQYIRNMFGNVAAFLRADFHMDAGMKNLFEAFYTSIQSRGTPPISHREILFTAAVMDEIFRQLDDVKKGSSSVSTEDRSAMFLLGENLSRVGQQ